MSEEEYIRANYTKTERCSKCNKPKTWDYWYLDETTLCDSCYYLVAKCNTSSKEIILTIQ